ncbi:MAG: hypothetical protein KatS3mg002_0620 [Candidatus Woesearchaeota archaeon]|nr:MAG: hypothetical protein KatS3mg002_0620 [Candidatus Woesearchaeota archaeon]
MNILKKSILKKSIRETLSDQIIEKNNLSLLEQKIETMCYPENILNIPNKEKPYTIDKIFNDIKGIYKYYFNPAVKTNKRAYTKILYNELKNKQYPDRLAETLAKATPVPIQNKYLKHILTIGYAITIGRSLSERHITWISQKSGIKERHLTRASFILEIPMHIITAGQLYPQLYTVTKGFSETINSLINKNINITPTYEQVLFGLCLLSLSQGIYSELKNKYVRGYHGATTLPFGAITFWSSTFHDKYLKYQEKISIRKIN